jgi:hypothetical protein
MRKIMYNALRFAKKEHKESHDKKHEEHHKDHEHRLGEHEHHGHAHEVRHDHEHHHNDDDGHDHEHRDNMDRHDRNRGRKEDDHDNYKRQDDDHHHDTPEDVRKWGKTPFARFQVWFVYYKWCQKTYGGWSHDMYATSSAWGSFCYESFAKLDKRKVSEFADRGKECFDVLGEDVESATWDSSRFADSCRMDYAGNLWEHTQRMFSTESNGDDHWDMEQRHGHDDHHDDQYDSYDNRRLRGQGRRKVNEL